MWEGEQLCGYSKNITPFSFIDNNTNNNNNNILGTKIMEEIVLMYIFILLVINFYPS